MWIATAEESREMDRQAEAMGISVESLMHEAGRAVAACVLENYPGAKRIGVVCGKGNNGGDGFVAARLLAEHLREVTVLVAAAESELNPNARRECDRLQQVGVKPRFWPPKAPEEWHVELVVDALLGTGATGPPSGPVLSAIEAIRAACCPVVSVDIPSGVHCDTGECPGEAVKADRTVTFGLPKPFLFQGAGAELCGTWSVVPIGFPTALLEAPRSARLFEAEDARRLMPMRSQGAHKGSEGHVLVIAGSDSMPGAAVLAARGALRAGAGLVTIASTEAVCRVAAGALPEALFHALPSERGVLGAESLKAMPPDLGRFDAAVIGPGLGASVSVGEFLRLLFSTLQSPAVLDADALNLIACGMELPGGPCVLTPHPGEAGRLMESDAAQVQADRFGSVRHLARHFGRTVLLKGAHSLVSEDGLPLTVNSTGNPGMAAPGMGDVLSGVIGALLAKRLLPFDAAVLGAYWHGLAGDLCAAHIGPAGYLASEVADMLPRARATIASS